jgi:3-hydroxybutyryl-CoA dehydrogenase
MPSKSFRKCEKRLELVMEGKYQWLDLRNGMSGIYYPVLQAKKHAGRSTGNMMGSEIKTIGVIGAGQMGNGIAQVAAAAGYRVQLYDLSAERIETALATVNGNLARQVASSKITEEERKAALARISGSSDINDLASADLVIEAATEEEATKRKIYNQVCPVLKPEAILATNTSSLSITRLASATDRPERFMGIHFMNPVPVMKLVELVRGIATDEKTFSAAKEFVGSLEKTITVAEDFPAFIVNRILLPMINEAIYTLYEGVGSVDAIDTAMKLGANHPMGPLQLADFIGLDTCLSIMQVLHDGLADSKYRPCPLLVKYVEAGWLGRKSGRGFYDYRGAVPVPTR